jgi:hypothetical protein
MQSPFEAGGRDPAAPPLRLGPHGQLEVSPDLATQADDRFQAVCEELGILLARRVEPVSARLLPFGTEQVAIVQLRDGADAPIVQAATGHGTSPAEAVAGAAIDAVTGGRSVLATALPGAVAEGKVRSAVVFDEGEAPVRWGRADDEARLAALYAVVPHLGSFTATTGADTYRVLRLPGIGVALVAEGQNAATWVDGWFAALLHAAQFAVRQPAPPTTVVAVPVAEDPASHTASVLTELEDECRRILVAAQDQARAIREEAERDAAATRAGAPSTASARHRDEHHEADDRDDATADERLARVRRESDALLVDAERARSAVLTDARREADAQRVETERACAELLETTKRECERLRADARSDVKRLRREEKRLRRSISSRGPSRSDGRYEDVVGDARRTADDLLRDARRAADDLIRDASRTRQRLVDDAVGHSLAPQVAAVPYAPPTTTSVAPGVAPQSAATEQATASLLAAAAESIATMSALLATLGQAVDQGPGRGARFGDEQRR